MNTSDFAHFKVSDLRAALIKTGMSKDEVSSIKGKLELVKRVISLGLQVTDIDVVKDDNIATFEYSEEDEIPEYGSLKWHSYVMSLFTVDELDNGAPKVEGLRRVANFLLGIVESGPIQVFPSEDPVGPGRATVVYQVAFNNGMKFREVADSCAGNTDPEYVKFPVAIASTRAEARALRKALMLKIHSADEISTSSVPDNITKESINAMVEKNTGTDIHEYELITDSQSKSIQMLCDRLDINVLKFINSGKGRWDALEFVEKHKAAEMIKKLSEFQKNPENIPVLIKKG